MAHNICPVCKGHGKLRVKRNGMFKSYSMKCHDCKAETIRTHSPELAQREWKLGYVFGGKFYSL